MTQQIQNQDPAQASSKAILRTPKTESYDIRVTTTQYVVKISTNKERGRFDRNNAEVASGGLVFDGLKLRGYDGVDVLPIEVMKVLEQCGFIVPDVFWG